MRLKQGDFRRMAALSYYFTRKLLKRVAFLMKREKKKRMMKRHMMMGAVALGLLDETNFSSDPLTLNEIGAKPLPTVPPRPPPQIRRQVADARRRRL